jgi:hypothetical protein
MHASVRRLSQYCGSVWIRIEFAVLDPDPLLEMRTRIQEHENLPN